jgi:anti-sigma B factor antagonist
VTNPAAEDAGHITSTVRTGKHGPVIVTLGGELDIMSAPAVREELLSLLRPGASRLVIDLSAIRYADASGLAVLVGTQRRALLLGGALRLAAPQPEVARVLAVTGIGRHLEVYPTVQGAIAGQEPAVGAAFLGSGLAITAARARPAQALPSQARPAQALPSQARPDQALPAQARPERAADSGELRAAVASVLSNADAWRDADPHRRFSAVLRALAQAYAGTSYALLVQAAQSVLSVLSSEPLTHSPVVAASASRLRRLLAPGAQMAAAAECRTVA